MVGDIEAIFGTNPRPDSYSVDDSGDDEERNEDGQSPVPDREVQSRFILVIHHGDMGGAQIAVLPSGRAECGQSSNMGCFRQFGTWTRRGRSPSGKCDNLKSAAPQVLPWLVPSRHVGTSQPSLGRARSPDNARKRSNPTRPRNASCHPPRVCDWLDLGFALPLQWTGPVVSAPFACRPRHCVSSFPG